MEPNDFERRLVDLETRVQRLESSTSPTPTTTSTAPHHVAPSAAHRDDRAITLVELSVQNKRFQPQNPMAGVYQEAIWFDLVLTLHPEAQPTRAVKGSLEFCDIFGEPRFVLGYTVNDPLQPGQPLRVPGIGFDFNEFLHDHKWMLVTDLNDMLCRFRVQQVMYADGSSEVVY